MMTVERARAINEWLGIHCRKCVNNDDRGTGFTNCQAECEVEKMLGLLAFTTKKVIQNDPHA